MRFSLGKWLLPLYSALALIFLLTPIVYTFVFSFNDSVKSNIVWVGFTLDNWTNVCDAQGVCAAFVTSILVGVVATLIATVLGTLLAIALARYRFRGRSVRKESPRSRKACAPSALLLRGSHMPLPATARYTRLVSTSKPAPGCATSLATMRSQRLRASFSCA